MLTYEKFGKYVGVHKFSYVYALYKLTARWSTMLYVVVSQDRMTAYGSQVVGTLCDRSFTHITCKLVISWNTLRKFLAQTQNLFLTYEKRALNLCQTYL